MASWFTVPFVPFCVRWYNVVQASGAANKVGSERSHQGGARWELLTFNIVLRFLKQCLRWILTATFFFFFQEHTVTWSAYLIISCVLKTQSWWICTRECIPAGHTTPMCPCLYPGSRERSQWIWTTWTWNSGGRTWECKKDRGHVSSNVHQCDHTTISKSVMCIN